MLSEHFPPTLLPCIDRGNCILMVTVGVISTLTLTINLTLILNVTLKFKIGAVWASNITKLYENVLLTFRTWLSKMWLILFKAAVY